MPQKTFIGTVIYWSWPILATSEQNTIISFTSPVWLGDRMRVRSQLYKSCYHKHRGFGFHFQLSESLCIFQHLWLPKDGRDRLKKSPVYIQDTLIINYPMLPILLKHWPSFLNTLISLSFHAWFASNSLSGTGQWWWQHSKEADPAAGGGRKAHELWPSLNMGLSLVWLQRINLINAYDTKEWLLFPKKTVPKINLYLEEFKSF